MPDDLMGMGDPSSGFISGFVLRSEDDAGKEHHDCQGADGDCRRIAYQEMFSGRVYLLDALLH